MRRISAIPVSCLLFGTNTGIRAVAPPVGNGHLMVSAFVKGKGTVSFIFETGADGTAVYQWFAAQQGVMPGKPISVEGMTGAAMMATYRRNSLTIDD